MKKTEFLLQRYRAQLKTYFGCLTKLKALRSTDFVYLDGIGNVSQHKTFLILLWQSA